MDESVSGLPHPSQGNGKYSGAKQEYQSRFRQVTSRRTGSAGRPQNKQQKLRQCLTMKVLQGNTDITDRLITKLLSQVFNQINIPLFSFT